MIIPILPSLVHEVAGTAHVDESRLLAIWPLAQAFHDGFAEWNIPGRANIDDNFVLFRECDDLVFLVEGAVDDALDASSLRQILVQGFVAQEDRDREVRIFVLQGQNEVSCTPC